MSRPPARYVFSGLPRLTRTRVQLVNRLLTHLPQTPFEISFKEQFFQQLQDLLQIDCDFWFDSINTVEAKSIATVVANPSCIAVLSLPPKPYKVFLECDLEIAQLCINRLLGGQEDELDPQRPLSEIEDGVFSFILLKILHLLHQNAHEEYKLMPKLEGIISTPVDLSQKVTTAEPWICINFRLFADVQVGYCRVMLPQGLIQDAFPVEVPNVGPAAARYRRRQNDRLDLISSLRTSFCAEVGRMSLPIEDLQSLDKGDIVLVEQTDLRLVDGLLQGLAECRIGKGNSGALRGQYEIGDNGEYQFVVEEIIRFDVPSVRRRLYLEDTPLEEQDKDMGYNDDDDGLPEANNLLQDVQASVVIELGRLQLSAADVVSLRPGQIMELGRAPGAAVDLVVDNKRIGKGELVDVEGELGVRILSLLK